MSELKLFIEDFKFNSQNGYVYRIDYNDVSLLIFTTKNLNVNQFIDLKNLLHFKVNKKDYVEIKDLVY